MFAIYTPEGRAFSGSLEKLRRVEKSVATNPTRSVANTETEIVDQDNTENYNISDKAVAQYRSLIKKEERREPVYHAYQIMSRDVRMINENWSLARAYEQFLRYPYQVFPVISDRRELLCTLSRQNFYRFVIETGRPVKADVRTVRQCFVEPNAKVYVADPVTDVRRIASLMVEKRLDAIPVLEETGRILGMVSRSDILRCAISDPPLSLWC